MILRVREHLISLLPSLERALDTGCQGPQLLLAKWQTPEAIRRTGHSRIARHLDKHRIRTAETVAGAAVPAALAQTVRLPGEHITARIVAEMAQALLDFDSRIKAADHDLADLVVRHPQAEGAPGRPHRAHGKRHIQAVIALDRRRVNVLWAMLRDNRPYTPSQPQELPAAA
jgi:hypothetical protein